MDFLKTDIHTMYDNIIMNPPYIKIQDLSVEYRTFLRDNFKKIKVGLIDIYYAFIFKCINLLSVDGRMVTITPNSYLYNKSSHKLRKYLFKKKLVEEIIDFNDKKVFKDASVYCCITVFTKSPKKYLIYNGKKIKYKNIKVNYSLFNHESTDLSTLKTICKISNGIATLRDKIFIHTTKLYNEPCWKSITNGNETKYIIYPYNDGKIIPENEFKRDNPQTYDYLLLNKDELSKRDKGRKTYPSWYAYGRSQSINTSSRRSIYIPCFIYPDNIKNCLFIKEPMLHHSCLCIEPKNEKDIECIIMSIIKNIDFITVNSSKRSGGWITLSSRILYQIPIYN
jgi:hypothetical protein